MQKLISLCLIIIFSFSGCTLFNKKIEAPKTSGETAANEEYLNIMASNKMLYHIIKDIVKDKHKVDYMIKEEGSVWDFKYTDEAVNNISNKDIFIYFDTSFEPWTDSFISKLNKGTVSVVNSSRGIKLLNVSTNKDYNGKEIKENPYYWTNVDNFKIALSNIKAAIQEKDPKNRSLYDNNYKEVIQQVDSYIESKKDLTKELKNYQFVTGGDSSDYFAKYLNVDTTNIMDAKKLAEYNDKLQNSKDKKPIIVLYNSDSELNYINNINTTLPIKKVKIITYTSEGTFLHLLKKNYESLESAIKS